MRWSKKDVQNCNFIIVLFIIVFLILGLMNQSRVEVANRIKEIDFELDRYEIQLQEYQVRLNQYQERSIEYERVYEDYENVYDEYSKLFDERKELYQNSHANSFLVFESNTLYFGAVFLAVLMIGINIYWEKFKKGKQMQWKK